MRPLSLIEVLLAAALSALLLSALMQALLSNQNLFLVQTDLAAQQDKSRLIHHLLQQAVKPAGYIGCARLTDDFPIYSSPANKNLLNSLRSGVRGFSSPPTTWPPAMRNKWQPGSDILLITSAATNLSKVAQAQQASNRIIIIATPKIKSGQKLLLSNCLHSEIVTVENVAMLNHKLIINIKGVIHFNYHPNSTLSLIVENYWFLGKQDILYQWRSGDQAIAWVRGIRTLKFKFGVNSPLSLLAWRDDRLVADWQQVNLLSALWSMDDGLKGVSTTAIRASI